VSDAENNQGNKRLSGSGPLRSDPETLVRAILRLARGQLQLKAALGTLAGQNPEMTSYLDAFDEDIGQVIAVLEGRD
jgi:hypothetical protein